jgi:3-dehydroquinate synthase
MQRDKKSEAGRLKFVLVRRLGEAFLSSAVPPETVRAVLAQ